MELKTQQLKDTKKALKEAKQEAKKAAEEEAKKEGGTQDIKEMGADEKIKVPVTETVGQKVANAATGAAAAVKSKVVGK